MATKSTEPMPEAAHVKALDRYKQYLIIGGMPAVINTFVQTKSIIAPVEIQQQILNDYTADMAKYASAYVNMSDFKIYGADVGLVTLKSGMPAQLILATDEPDNRFLGGLAENYVAQALACNGHKLYYWKNK